MKALVLVALVACQQEKPAPRVVPRDAKADAPPPEHALKRDANPPRLRMMADYPNEGSIRISFDSAIRTLRRDEALDDGSVAWRVTLSEPVLVVAHGRTVTRTAKTDDDSRSFVLDVPAGIAVDLHVGQILHGSLGIDNAPMSYRTWGAAADERGKVFEVGTGPFDMKLGKVTHDIEGMPFEQLHEVEVKLDGEAWSSLAGWSHWTNYAVYGLAGKLKEGAVVDDYFPWQAFAMIRQPG